MSRIKTCFIVGALFIISGCHQSEKEKNIIKVAIFDSKTDCRECITDVIESLKIDILMESALISAVDIAGGGLDKFDVLIIPGGSGRSMTNNMGETGMNIVRDWVSQQGKGIVGICAGAYALSNTPDYPSLGLSGARAIDIEHDNRGHGLVKFTLSVYGKSFFPEVAHYDTLYCMYYEGPVIEDADDVDFNYIELATMKSDVHAEAGSPALMTLDRPFIFANQVGKGRAVSFVGHPERTPGMRWMLPRMVRWANGTKTVKYDPSLVKPELYKKEIIFTNELKNEEQLAILKLSGNKNDRLTGMYTLVNLSSWSAKQYIPGLLRDTASDVRMVAAKYIYELECTEAIPDLELAIKMEKKDNVKEFLQKYHSQLLKYINK